jgi:hypothetical protein
MRYLFLAYGDEQQWSALPAREQSDLESACRTHDEMLRQKGHLLAVEQLRGNATSTLVQIQDGQLCLTDGPLAAGQTQLIAFYFIDARDLNEAIRIASTMPQARLGPIEVRPFNAQEI